MLDAITGLISGAVGATVTLIVGHLSNRDKTVRYLKKKEAISFLNKKRSTAAEFLANCEWYYYKDRNSQKDDLYESKKKISDYFFIKLTYGDKNSSLQKKIDSIYDLVIHHNGNKSTVYTTIRNASDEIEQSSQGDWNKINDGSKYKKLLFWDLVIVSGALIVGMILGMTIAVLFL